MALREKQLAQAAITASNATVYTVPVNVVTMMKDFDLANTTVGDLTVNIHIVPDEGVAGTDNAIAYEYVVLANDVYSWRGLQVMEAGGKIIVKASAVGLTITASGVERRLQ